MLADFKPRRRHRADAKEWTFLRALKMGPCRICPSTLAVQMHHLVGRDLGGDDAPQNLVPLCPLHHQQVQELEPESCEALRATLTLSEYAYIVDRKGLHFLDRYYPRAPRAEDPSATERAEASDE
jgi:hypothetical protein